MPSLPSTLVAVAAVIAVTVVAAPAAPAEPVPGGAAPRAADAVRTVTWTARTAGTVSTSRRAFARAVAATLDHSRGWAQAGTLRWRQVRPGQSAELTVWLAAPAAVPGFSPACSPSYSCRVGPHVVVNDARWTAGSDAWGGPLRAYRRYVVNHEVGHWLGLGHAGCPGAGARAPVMMQQTKGTGACRPSAWPQAVELRRAGLPVAGRRRPEPPLPSPKAGLVKIA